ncbi:hypothetical protein [Alteraurantiacibacter buctensis]|uniref:DUF3617 family protein n=1 Tax=Alteraurantiacibacter buctensis TaxID=1503981 RepID=A0A844Z1L1_9SPHN|nr:hypothetical protein [Alteraurantiacibacter buctensis]MXO72584.1 hypothetical protein [Alteraurantiacibacter buctensis]
MKRLPATIAVAATLLGATPALAQDATAAPIAADFKLESVEEDDGDWGITEFLVTQQAAQQEACGSASDLLAAQSTTQPRYDENGALVRQEPSAACAPSGSRYGSLARWAAAEQERRAAQQRNSATGFLREPECTESATGYTCASSGQSGRTTYQREVRCEETPTGRTCSSSGSIGTSSGAANAAREAVERMLDD